MDKKKLFFIVGTTAVAAVAVTVVVFFIVSNTIGAMGNQFVAPLDRQLLLYGRFAGILMGIVFFFLLLSMGKGRLLEHFFPKALLAKWHRRFGLATGILLILHIGLIVAGRTILYEESPVSVAKAFVLDKSWGSLTSAGVAVMIAVLIFCIFFVAKKIKFPAWKKSHYFVYLFVPMVFFHQIFYGLDFVQSPVFRIFWIVLFSLAALDVIVWKISGRIVGSHAK